MTSLFAAVNQEQTVTENGMPTLTSSLNANVDLFFKAGASRGKFTELAPNISSALAEDTDTAVRILLWMRDVRQGAGERQLFRDAIALLFQSGSINKEQGDRIVIRVPELGRWDDLFAFIGTPSEGTALSLFAGAIRSGNGLAAKWAPRKGANAARLRNAMGLTPRQYRKLIVGNTNVVETKMCAKKWDSIEFGKVPSLAAARYQKAFWRNAKDEYTAYMTSLEKGEDKINAGAVYPYDIIKSVFNGNEQVASEQWRALPDYMEGSETTGILPVVDVSGSMSVPAGGSGMVTCMDVAASLGMYISERNRGIFCDQFVTFSQSPKMIKLKGSLSQRVRQLKTSDWGMNTDLEAVFDLLLSSARRNSVPESEMPDTILILSDMQFDQATGRIDFYYRGLAKNNPTSFDMIAQRYERAGYKMPKLVYWNINSRNGVPVEFDKDGTALVSGFSPAIMKSVLSAKTFTPEEIMLDAVGGDRYQW